MVEVGIKQAKAELSQLFERALAGELVLIARNGRERLRLVPYDQPSKPTGFGEWRKKLRKLPADYWTNPKYDDELAELFESSVPCTSKNS